MTDRPILFSAPMVRAILDGSKTQTRRIVKPVKGFESCDICRPDFMTDPDKVWWHGTETERVGVAQSCPYGQIGDRLWVREAFHDRGDNNIAYRATQTIRISGKMVEIPLREPDNANRWKPSIYMPRWASRITLEITDVRVERLQDISEDDAQAEGIERVGGRYSCEPWKNYMEGRYCSAPSRSFQTLWQSINGPESWDANPWVWVIWFKRVDNGKACE